MALKCYVWQGRGGYNELYAFIGCAKNPSWIQGISQDNKQYFLPADGGQVANGAEGFDVTADAIIPCNSDADITAATQGRTVRDRSSSCRDFSGSKTYDCLNGKCIENTSNSGYFKSLEDCQKICGFQGSCGEGKQCIDPNTFCPPGKVCLDSSEYSQINSIIDRLGQEFCN